MAQTKVSSCVLSIIASFASGLDVFRKFRETQGRRKRRSKRTASVQDEELRLVRSLRQGPEDIGREYQRSLLAIGDRFAHGDGIAQTSLAEILLKLNTGLVTIINTFLTKHKHDANLDYQSLTSLSERSRVDTCRTLRKLFHRLMHCSLPAALEDDDSAKEPFHRPKDTGASRRRPVDNAKQTRVKGPTLARVVIADSSKPSHVAMVRPGAKRKASSNVSSSSSKVQSHVVLGKAEQSVSQVPEKSSTHRLRGGQSLQDMQRAKRKPSSMQVNNSNVAPGPNGVHASMSTPRLNNAIVEHELPPMSVAAQLPVSRNRMRKPTPTFYSIETTSTKLGEIPMHKWTEPYDWDAMSRLNREAESSGWPLNELSVPEKRKKGGLFRLFRRKGSEG